MADLLTLAEAQAALTDLAALADLPALVAAASTEIRTLCRGRSFELAQRTETYSGRDRDYLILSEIPVQSVTAISIGGVVRDPSTFQVEGHTGKVRVVDPSIRGGFAIFDAGFQNITATYTGGYDPIPSDLKRAALILIRTNYEMGQIAGGGIILERVTDTEHTIQRSPSKVDRMDVVKSIIRNYRNRRA